MTCLWGYDLWELRQRANEAWAEQDRAKAQAVFASRRDFIARMDAHLHKLRR